MQRAKLIACVMLFVLTLGVSLMLMVLAGNPGNEWMVLATVGVQLLFAVIASALIMSYLNADLKARGLRWRY